MTKENGKYFFGFWDEEYGTPDEKYEDFEHYRNTIDKKAVIQHIETLKKAITIHEITDRFTGEKFKAGIYMDGDFTFSTDFVRYYKTQSIGIPYEYEEYLKKKLK